jgi:hypothetical protein
MIPFLLFHYPEGTLSLNVYEEKDRKSWVQGLIQLLGNPDRYYTGYSGPRHFFREYNELQGSDAPAWKKIATGMIRGYSVILDEDREQVAQALHLASTEIKCDILVQGFDVELHNTINQVAEKMQQLPSGLIVVTADGTEKPFYEQRVNIPALRESLDRIGDEPLEDIVEKALIDATCRTPVQQSRIIEMFQRAIDIPRYLEMPSSLIRETLI